LKRFSESVLNALPEACLVCDLKTKPTYWNDAFKRILGLGDEDMSSLVLVDLFAPEEAEKLQAAIEDLLETGRVVIETVALAKGGRRIPCEISASLVKDNRGEPVGICGIGRDVSQRVAAEKALKESREHLQATLNALPDIMFEVDRHGRIYDYRADKDAPLHAQPSDVMGKTVDEIIPMEPASIIMTAIQRAAQTGRYKGAVYTLEMPTGLSWFELSITSKGDIHVDEPRFIALVRDITDRQRAIEALRDERNFISAVLDTAAVLVVVLDREGKIVRFNRACETTTGYTSSEVKGKPIWDIFLVPEELDQVRATFEELRSGMFPNAFENHWLTRGGERRRISWSNTALVDDDDVVQYTVSSGIDITEKRKVERALRESEAKYRAIFQDTREGILMTDPRGVITEANAGAASMFGYENPGELIGLPVQNLYMFPDQRESVIEELLQKGSSERVELAMKKKDGSAVYALVSLTVQRDEGGAPLRYESILMDITDRKRMEDELQQINVELEGYAHTVSHDLKSPLSVIAVAHETIADFLKRPMNEVVYEDIDELMWIIGSNLSKSILLIEDLLALAEAGREPGELARVRVSEVLAWVLQEREADVRERGITVTADADLGEVTADLVHMYELFANLVGNAINHNEGRGLVVQVSHLGEDDEGGHRYLFRDNGKGIPPQILDKVFKPFVKSDKGGTGIGLAIVQRIIETYDGSIRAYNDRGACFEFLIRDRGD
jgi:PAS domain S-box-containing protein